MGKIVGNYWYLFLMTTAISWVHARVDLKVRDGNGRVVKQVTVGYPFTVEVVLDGEHGCGRNPTVEGLNYFLPGGRQTKCQTVNGVTTASYVYTLTAKNTGTYEIGPAQISHNGSTVKSKKLTVVVVDDDQELRREQKFDSVIMKLQADKTKVVVGESILCSLQLWCSDDAIVIQEIQRPQWEGFSVTQLGEPVKKTEEIDGIEYTIIEWTWQLYPEKPGRMVIPATAVNFKEPVEGNGGSFSQFSFFFTQRYKNKRVHSNTLAFEVDPLPPYAGDVQGVGRFSQLQVEVKPVGAKQGEGMVAQICLRRSSDSHLMKSPELINIPDGLRVYHSRNYAIPQNDGSIVECIEYVMQGMKVGVWVIPAQTFTYFDIGLHEYKTLKSSPMTIPITASTAQEDQNNVQPTISSEKEDHSAESAAIDEDQEIRPLQRGIWHPQTERFISWWLFLLMIVVPAGWCLVEWGKKLWMGGGIRRQRIRDKKRAFVHARAALQLAEKNNLYGHIYPIFVQLFIAREAIDRSDDVHEQITQIMRASLSGDQLSAWETFFSSCMQHMFFKDENHHNRQDDQLFKRASAWLAALETMI